MARGLLLCVVVCLLGTVFARKNVLFLVVDDMRPSMGAYNYSHARTPNIDALAKQSLMFTSSYIQYAYCSPSRNSFMTGRRPDTTRVWEFVDHFREKGVGADWISLPEYFKKNDYLTLGGGKLFHPASATENIGMPNNDYPASWTPEYPYFDNQPANGPHKCANGVDPGTVNPTKGTATWCAAEVDKDAVILSDQKIRQNCLDHLQLAANLTKSPTSKYDHFFVGCGFHKPHVPWVAPKEFFDELPIKTWEAYPLAADPYAPVGMPPAAWHPPADVAGMTETPMFNGTFNATRSKLYRRAYDAAISYQDYNIGRVLAELQRLGLEEDTVVTLFGDHGWQLGEHDTWAKMTNFELATRIPLFIKAPHKPQSIGQSSHALVEAVDLYPTLADLAGLAPPSSMGQALNGTSLGPLFDDPASSVKDAAFSQFGKISTFDVTPRFHRNETKLMGYTVRVRDWRYTAWFRFDQKRVVPMTSPADSLGRELYDHRGDTGLWLDFPGENRNLVDLPEHKELVERLHQKVLEYIQLRPVA